MDKNYLYYWIYVLDLASNTPHNKRFGFLTSHWRVFFLMIVEHTTIFFSIMVEIQKLHCNSTIQVTRKRHKDCHLVVFIFLSLSLSINENLIKIINNIHLPFKQQTHFCTCVIELFTCLPSSVGNSTMIRMSKLQSLFQAFLHTTFLVFLI